MGKQYHVLFILYFCLCAINLLYVSTAAHYFLSSSKKCLCLNSTLVCISGAFTLAWMIYASVMTWGDEGQKCDDEDLLPKSRMFIYVWLIVLYCGLGLMCCCACMMAVIVSNNKRKKAKRQNMNDEQTLLRS